MKNHMLEKTLGSRQQQRDLLKQAMLEVIQSEILEGKNGNNDRKR